MVVSSIEHEICSVMVQVLIQEAGQPDIKTEPLPKRHISDSLVYCQGGKCSATGVDHGSGSSLRGAKWMIRGAY